ncbi:MAG: nucleotide exchange factor GrpE, partial [Arenicellales bacterium]
MSEENKREEDEQPQSTEAELVDEAETVDVDAVADNEADAPSYEALVEEVLNLREKNNGLVDQFARAKAETDNTRRISTKEVEKARKFALEGFAKELLSVKDSLGQAAQVDLQSDANEQIIKQMSEGLELTLKQLDTVFERFKIEEVRPEAGDAVDPELHQAMTMQPSDEVDANNIIS